MQQHCKAKNLCTENKLHNIIFQGWDVISGFSRVFFQGKQNAGFFRVFQGSLATRNNYNSQLIRASFTKKITILQLFDGRLLSKLTLWSLSIINMEFLCYIV